MARVWQMKSGIWSPNDNKFLVVRRDGTVPKWPHFTLGARDPVAAIALRGYAEVARFSGMGAEYADSVRELAAVFDAYRAEHGTGGPPAGPHRRDDPDVVAALSGGEPLIRIKHDT